MERKEKQPVHKVVMTEGKRNIIRELFEKYDIQDAMTFKKLSRTCWAEPPRR